MAKTEDQSLLDMTRREGENVQSSPLSLRRVERERGEIERKEREKEER